MFVDKWERIADTPCMSHTQCKARRVDGSACSLHADRLRDGWWYCHIHDPEGQAFKNWKAKRDTTKLPPAPLAASRQGEYAAVVALTAAIRHLTARFDALAARMTRLEQRSGKP